MGFLPKNDTVLTGNPRGVTQSPGDNDTSLATTAFVTAAVAGINVSADWKDSVQHATAAALPANTRTSNTLDADANGELSIDGQTPSNGDYVLVKNESTGANNGIYEIDDIGSVGTPWAMTRRADADVDAEVTNGMTVFVAAGGTANGNTIWTLTTADPITVNTTALVFTLTGSLPSIQNLGDLQDVDVSGVVDGALFRYEATGTEWNDTSALLFTDADQLQILSDNATGGLVMGASGDVNLYRATTNVLKTDDRLDVGNNVQLGAGGGVGISQTASNAYQDVTAMGAASTVFFTIGVSGDSQRRYSVRADGMLEWGSGSVARDTNLYRSAANVLKTDDSFTVGQTLTMEGGVVYNIVSKAVGDSPYSVLDSDGSIHVDCSGGAVTITLPASHTAGRRITIVDASGDAETNNITVGTADSDTINEASTYVLDINRESITVESDGTNWILV